MTIPVALGAQSYDIVLERGCLARAGALLNLDRRVLILTDEGVPAAYAETLAGQCAQPLIHRVPQGEDSKSFARLEELLTVMLRARFDRGDCVCAVGGGVVGDLAGFAAATYMRGVAFYNLPTTVLSQVDSSVGGKTAVNLDGVKNVAGAFYQPRRVLIDPDTLNTLPPRQIASGLAEAVKMALCGDAALFSLFEREEPMAHLERILADSVSYKASVVAQDEREQGLRRVLNFGHTIGHGIESVTGLYHGECVALGMLPMCAPETRARARAVLERLGLPTAVRGDPERVYEAMLHDKKAAGGVLRTVRVDEPGAFRFEDVPPEALREGIAMVVTP